MRKVIEFSKDKVSSDVWKLLLKCKFSDITLYEYFCKVNGEFVFLDEFKQLFDWLHFKELIVSDIDDMVFKDSDGKFIFDESNPEIALVHFECIEE